MYWMNRQCYDVTCVRDFHDLWFFSTSNSVHSKILDKLPSETNIAPKEWMVGWLEHSFPFGVGFLADANHHVSFRACKLCNKKITFLTHLLTLTHGSMGPTAPKATGSRTMAWTKKLLRGLQMHEGLEPLLRHVGGGNFRWLFFLRKEDSSKNDNSMKLDIFLMEIYSLLILNISLQGWFWCWMFFFGGGLFNKI